MLESDVQLISSLIQTIVSCDQYLLQYSGALASGSRTTFYYLDLYIFHSTICVLWNSVSIELYVKLFTVYFDEDDGDDIFQDEAITECSC